jgi:hypothetical protein
MNIINIFAHSGHAAEQTGPSSIGYIVCAVCVGLLVALLVAAVTYNLKVSKRRSKQFEPKTKD